MLIIINSNKNIKKFIKLFYEIMKFIVFYVILNINYII